MEKKNRQSRRPSEIVVIATTSSYDEALKISEAAVTGKVAACANIIREVRSIFRWQGKIERKKESLILFKTTRASYRSLERTIKENHSYKVPEIIALPIILGSAQYLAWVKDQTHN